MNYFERRLAELKADPRYQTGLTWRAQMEEREKFFAREKHFVFQSDVLCPMCATCAYPRNIFAHSPLSILEGTGHQFVPFR